MIFNSLIQEIQNRITKLETEPIESPEKYDSLSKHISDLIYIKGVLEATQITRKDVIQYAKENLIEFVCNEQKIKFIKLLRDHFKVLGHEISLKEGVDIFNALQINII